MQACRKLTMHYNLRAQVWAEMRDWLKMGAEIPDTPELADDLCGVEYGFSAKGAIQLEKKEDMKRRGLSSPDLGGDLSSGGDPFSRLERSREQQQQPTTKGLSARDERIMTMENQQLREERDLLLLSLTYWDSAGNPAKTIPGLTQSQMGHACEWETSMVLRLAPHLVVGDVTQVPEVPAGKGFTPGYRAWVMPDRSEPGHIGNPSAATPEKGEALFQFFANGVASYLERVIAWDGKVWDY